MKELKASMTMQEKLIGTLKYIVGDMRKEIIAIANLLETEEQQEEMLIYLANNYQNKELMRIDRLLKKSLEIAEN